MNPDPASLLPPHKASLSITHNQHLAYYETAEQYMTGRESSGEAWAWPDEQARQRCIDTNEIWEMQWYPDTPIGSHSIAAPTLKELLDYAATF